MKVSWEYIAGFFDGEGSISVIQNRARPNSLVMNVTIAQSGRVGLKVLQDIGELLREDGILFYIQEREHGTSVKATKPMYILQIMSRPNIVNFLCRVFPYLRVKKVKAQDLLRYLKLYPSLHGCALKDLHRDRLASGWYGNNPWPTHAGRDSNGRFVKRSDLDSIQNWRRQDNGKTR